MPHPRFKLKYSHCFLNRQHENCKLLQQDQSIVFCNMEFNAKWVFKYSWPTLWLSVLHDAQDHDEIINIISRYIDYINKRIHHQQDFKDKPLQGKGNVVHIKYSIIHGLHCSCQCEMTFKIMKKWQIPSLLTRSNNRKHYQLDLKHKLLQGI